MIHPVKIDNCLLNYPFYSLFLFLFLIPLFFYYYSKNHQGYDYVAVSLILGKEQMNFASFESALPYFIIPTFGITFHSNMYVPLTPLKLVVISYKLYLFNVLCDFIRAIS